MLLGFRLFTHQSPVTSGNCLSQLFQFKSNAMDSNLNLPRNPGKKDTGGWQGNLVCLPSEKRVPGGIGPRVEPYLEPV